MSILTSTSTGRAAMYKNDLAEAMIKYAKMRKSKSSVVSVTFWYNIMKDGCKKYSTFTTSAVMDFDWTKNGGNEKDKTLSWIEERGSYVNRILGEMDWKYTLARFFKDKGIL